MYRYSAALVVKYMNSKLNPYLHFDGKAKEAMEFYKSVFGGELTMSTFAQGMPGGNPGDAEKIMHAQLLAGGMTLMASDSPSEWPLNPGASVTLSLSGEDETELKGYWDKLSEGAKIGQPLTPAPWGDQFGMLTDKFDMEWMVNITAKKS